MIKVVISNEEWAVVRTPNTTKIHSFWSIKIFLHPSSTIKMQVKNIYCYLKQHCNSTFIPQFSLSNSLRCTDPTITHELMRNYRGKWRGGEHVQRYLLYNMHRVKATRMQNYCLLCTKCKLLQLNRKHICVSTDQISIQ